MIYISLIMFFRNLPKDYHLIYPIHVHILLTKTTTCHLLIRPSDL